MGTGIRGGTDMVTGCGANQAFYQSDETERMPHDTSYLTQQHIPKETEHEQTLFEELVEAAGDIDFDELCNDLLNEGFPDFENIQTDTIDQDNQHFEKAENQTNYALEPSNTQVSLYYIIFYKLIYKLWFFSFLVLNSHNKMPQIH